MTDNIQPLEAHNAEDQQPSAQDIFDAKFQKLMNGFSKACEEEGIKTAVAIAMFPELPPEDMEQISDKRGYSPLHPLVFYRGHLADAAALQAAVLRAMKAELMQTLSID